LSILSATYLSCEKSDRRLFSDLHLTLDVGELLHVQGDNGAGKTSLLRILVGLSQSLTGEVIINQHNVLKEQSFAGNKLVYLGHKAGVSATLSAIENLNFWAKQQSLNLKNNSITDVLDELELTGLEDIPTKHLSAGQQRRVGLAKLWLKSHANLWVLDEPFTALDVSMIHLLQCKMLQFLQTGGAIIMTSHQPLSIDHPVRILKLAYQW